ncbi:Ig-like domain-containing protein [Nocardioides zeicaulis]|uniref:Ig-like domain-containing protein n=1 Tax=Nocardioides zeicaulis TaxID=1776857 RepID=A0ABV6E4Y0_9ACTN
MATTTAGAALLLGLGALSATPATPAQAAAAAPSSTTLTLSATSSAYGQTVTASASVVVSPGPASGDVVFAVDGLAYKANLGAAGTATLVLPDAAVGTHAVTATFVPQDAVLQQGSTSPAQPWTVGRVRTRLQPRVVGKGLRTPTSLVLTASGEYGSVPGGEVRVRLQRHGRLRATERVGLTGAPVRVGFGRLPRGAYRVVVRYAGDASHLPEKRVVRFRVRQR